MNTVDSWIDQDLLADLVTRLKAPAGVGRAGALVGGAPRAEAAGRPAGEAAPAGSVVLSPQDAEIEVVRPERGGESSAGDADPGAGVPEAEPDHGNWEQSIADGALPGGRRRQLPGEPAARQRVRRRLAEIKAQAARSGLLGAAQGPGARPDQPFTSADEAAIAAVDALAGSKAAAERLSAFARQVVARFGCVRVLVSDSRGASLLPTGESEPALLAAAQSLSHSWLGCQKHLRLKDPGVLSTALGKGYRMIVIPCETEQDVISLALVTRDLVSDSEMMRLRRELLAVMDG